MEGVLKCYPHETLETIIDRIAKAEVTHMYYCICYCNVHILTNLAKIETTLLFSVYDTSQKFGHSFLRESVSEMLTGTKDHTETH